MSHIDLDRVALFYTEHGKEGADAAGPTLLLVHGWGGAGDQWAALLPQLDPTCRVIIPDLRGHGASRTQWTDRDWAEGVVRDEDFTPRAFAADLAALLAELQTGPVVAVGHSMGGQVVTALAVEYPELVSALIVLDPAYGADDTEIMRIPSEQAALRCEGSAWAARFVAGAFSPDAPAGTADREQRLMLSTDPRVLAAARDAMYLTRDSFGARRAAAAYLARCEIPTLAIYSNEGAAQWYRERGLRNSASTVEVVPEAGHYLQIERAELVGVNIKTFTARLRRGHIF